MADRAGVDGVLFDAALDVRAELGRVNDLIHAVAITMILPRILEPEERLVRRPSLAAGNDPTRPYDLETDRRVAEFKLSVWKGADAMRKRQAFKDLVHLVADNSGRRPELYVVGAEPIRFLRTSRVDGRVGIGLVAVNCRALHRPVRPANDRHRRVHRWTRRPGDASESVGGSARLDEPPSPI